MPLPEPAHPTPPCPCRFIKLIKPWTEESSDEDSLIVLLSYYVCIRHSIRPPPPCRLIKLIKPWTEESSDEEGSEGEAEEGGDGAAGGPPVGQQVGSDVCRAH